MPILFSLSFCLALGAYTEARFWAGRNSVLGPLSCVALTQALFLTPAWTSLYLLSPAYAFLYRFDPVSYPQLAETGWATLGYNVASFSALLLGLKSARTLRARRSLRRLCLYFALALLAVATALFWQRLVFLGDYEAFWLREAVPVWREPRMWVVWVLLVGAVSTPYLATRPHPR